jgi:thymidylate synthase
MSLGASKARLAALTKDLVVRWEATRESWTDAKGGEFERTYLVELAAAVDRAGTVLDQLDRLVLKLRSDCE